MLQLAWLLAAVLATITFSLAAEPASTYTHGLHLEADFAAKLKANGTLPADYQLHIKPFTIKLNFVAHSCS